MVCRFSRQNKREEKLVERCMRLIARFTREV